MATPYTPTDFLADYYLAEYPDVSRVYGAGNWDGASDHYHRFGLNEGRSPNPFFAPAFYLSKYDDLSQKFGNDYSHAAEHWAKFGIDEGRQGSIGFDSRYYLDHYPDLTQIFGPKGFRDAFRHYLRFGLDEARIPSAEAYAQMHSQPTASGRADSLLRGEVIIIGWIWDKITDHALEKVFDIPDVGKDSDHPERGGGGDGVGAGLGGTSPGSEGLGPPNEGMGPGR